LHPTINAIFSLGLEIIILLAFNNGYSINKIIKISRAAVFISLGFWEKIVIFAALLNN